MMTRARFDELAPQLHGDYHVERSADHALALISR
jgi:hypothetical protein